MKFHNRIIQIKFVIAIILCFVGVFAKAQNPNTITLTNQQALTVDETKRASTKILLQAGFKYGQTEGANRLTLQVSSYPSYVENGYSNPPSSCGLSLGLSNSLVGETAGTFGVSPQGQATYNIPIFVSPGTAGMQPNLALSYISGTGSGLAGEGFNLSGLSAIMRVNKTPYLDGKYGGVNLDYTDAFALNGSRLLLLTGSNGTNGSTYDTEIENYSTITAQSTQGNGPERFTVIEKTGTTIEYGGTSDSRLRGVNDNTVLAWLVNKITDEFGNYMQFTYRQLDGEAVIDHIDYTGNLAGGLMPYAQVSFEYMTKTEKNKFYVATKEFNSTQLLKSITCTYEGSLVKKYKLNYIFEQHTLLQSVTEINPDGTELKPTEFCWSNPANNASYANMQSAVYPVNSPLYNQISKIISADLNGDGLSDVISLRNAPLTPMPQIDYIKNNYLNYYGGSSSSLPFTTIWSNNLPSGTNRVETSSVFDIDFDNKQEVYFIQSDGVAKQYTITKVTETGITTFGSYSTTNSFSSGETPSKFYFDINDYTGDGEKETVIIDPEKISVTGISGNYTYNFTNSSTIAKPCDFNGDGVLDFITIKNNNNISLDINVLKLDNTGFTTIHSQSITFTGNVTYNNLLQSIGLGDFNGDGKTDFLYLYNNKQSMFIKYSDGSVFLNPKQVNSFTPLLLNPVYNISCPDFNGDGYSDIIITQNTSSNTTDYQTYYSVGNNLVKGITTSGYFNYNSIEVLKIQKSKAGYKVINEMVSYAASYQFQADFNGDGKMDLISLDPATPSIIIAGAIDAENRNIVSIYTGLRTQTDILYSNTSTKINHPRQFIYSDAATNYSGDLASINPCMFVVDKVSIGNSNTQFQNKAQYFYQGAIFHKKGKGFLGFESFGSFDVNTGLGSISSITINATNFLPQNTEQLTGTFSSINTGGSYIFSRGNLISKKHTDFQISSVGSHRYFVAPATSSDINYLNASASSTSSNYDLSKQGNLSSSTITYGWPGQATVKTENENFTYVSVNGRWRVQTKSSSKTQTGEPSYNRSILYNYDGQGHITSVTNDPTFGTQSLQTSFLNINAFGNPTKSTISAGDITSRTSEITYDAKGRFVTQTKNALSQAENFVYNQLYGMVLQKTDAGGLISKYKYDGIGRLIESKLPNNTTNVVEYTYDNGGVLGSPIVYKKKVLNEGTAEVYSFYDSFDRLMKTQTKDAFDNVVISDNSYDIYGNLEYSSEPHFTSQQSYLATKYTRESTFNRPSKTETVKYTLPSGSSIGTYASTGIFTQYKYSNILSSLGSAYSKDFIETSDNTGKVIRKEFNAARQNDVVSNGVPSTVIIGGTDITQTSTYNFASNGQPKNVTLSNTQNANTVTHSFVYNQLGYQAQLIDPSAGTINYTYNTLGELLHQDDANGIWDFTYDVLGRMDTKTGSQSGTTTYQYVASGDGINQIKKITGQNAITEFTYDNLSRNTQFKESVGAKTFITEMAYDKYGNTVETKYPSGYRTKYQYTPSGALSAITDASNNAIWQLDELNSTGQLTKYTYGNGIQTSVSYNYLHQLDLVEHGTIHKQDYNFDPLTGTLNSREFYNYDAANSSHNFEKFTYDNLDRLNQFQQQDPANFYTPIYTNNTNIDVIGNIIDKDDAGHFVYGNPTKPFNLTQITSPTPNVPTNPLQILYNDLRKVKQITDAAANKEMNFTYGNDNERIKVEYLVNGVNQYTRYYQSNYETEESTLTGTTKEWTYIYAPNGLAAIYYKTNTNTGQLLYVLSDHLGSPILLTDNNQVIKEKYSFDAWGRRRNSDNWSYVGLTPNQYLNRGYTFHEHINEFNLINMNGRVYDPVLGRFIQPDNYIQSGDILQSFNRYAYVFNNPLSSIDPDGNNPIVIGAIVGGIVGAYFGFKEAQSIGESGGWFYFRHMIGYTVIGAVSGAAGAYIGGSGIAFANLASIFVASTVNSALTNVYTRGESDVSFSLGAASFNASTDEWGYLGKSGNSGLQNFGYTLGALAAIQDIFAGVNGTDVDVLARKDIAGHSELKGEDILISVGPDDARLVNEAKDGAQGGLKWEAQFLKKSTPGQNYDYITLHPRPTPPFKLTLNNVNGRMLRAMTRNLDNGQNLTGTGTLQYSVLRGCVNYSSRALLFSGVININAFLPITSPVLLNFELAIRQYGIYVSPYLTR